MLIRANVVLKFTVPDGTDLKELGVAVKADLQDGRGVVASTTDAVSCELEAIDELYERIVADHAKWRGKVVQVRTLQGGNGNDWAGWMDLGRDVPVTVLDARLSEPGDCIEHGDEGGLIDVSYPIAEAGPFPDFAECPDAVAHAIDGPTYYRDGRVDYPSWWPKTT
jgi:hypothetical protein